MRLLSIEQIKTNCVLGKSIYNERNQVLLGAGVVLTERLIERLKDLGVTYVYIQDEKTENINPQSTISDQLRKEATSTIESVLKQIDIDDQFMDHAFLLETASKKFKDIIREIVKEIKQNEELLTLLSEVYVLDEYIFTHSLNVTFYSLAIGLELNLPQKELELLGMGSLLHDVGKLKVSPKILLKPGKLTEEEYEEIKKHAEFGFRILKQIHSLPLTIAHCAYQHHERLNGSGYPRGLREEEIHFYGKIIAVADVFDAVTSHRIYRKAMLPHEGLEILYSGSGTMYDREIIEAFRKSVAVYPVGITVVLSDQRVGVVMGQNKGLGDRPTIQIIEENGLELIEPYQVNLLNQLDVTIIACNDNRQIRSM